MPLSHRQLTTLGVLLRWLKARREVEASMWAARSVVVAAQLREMRGTYA